MDVCYCTIFISCNTCFLGAAQIQLNVQPETLTQAQLSPEQESPDPSSLLAEDMAKSSSEKEPCNDITAKSSDAGPSLLPPASITEETADTVVVPEQEIASGLGDVPQEEMEEEVRESDLQVQEEEISSLQNEQQVSDEMELDSGPYFRAPRPPRRVSLLEYKERMKGKKQPLTDEVQQGDAEMSTDHQTKESRVTPPLTEGGGGTDDPRSSQEAEQKLQQSRDITSIASSVLESQGPSEVVSLASQLLQSVIDTKLADGKSDSQKLSSEQPQQPLSSPVTHGALDLPQKGISPHPTRKPASIEWPTTTTITDETETNIVYPTETLKRKCEDVEREKSEETLRVEKDTVSVPIERDGREKRGDEREKKARRSKEYEERTQEQKKAKGSKEDEEKDDRKWEERERERDRERAKRLEWRSNREKEMEEKEITRKSANMPLGHSEQHLTHTPSPPFPPAKKRYTIPIRHGSATSSYRRPRPLPPPTIPPTIPPQPPPPQPFIGFPPHPHAPFHQAPPAPFTPPHPHPPLPPQHDIWSMFGNFFVQQNLLPTEDPPPPPPRPPSPPLPPQYRRSPSRHSSPPRQASSPHCSSRSSPTPMSPRRNSHSPEPPPFLSRTTPPPPVSSLRSVEPKPRQLDAKQFRVISELIKRTTVQKCDISVQTVPPRMVSEGTQDGRGFRLRSTAVQVKTKTYDVSTDTDSKPEIQHRLVGSVIKAYTRIYMYVYTIFWCVAYTCNDICICICTYHVVLCG